MSTKTECQFCHDDMGPGREFVYQYELLQYQDPRVLEIVKRYGLQHDEPLRVCEHCHHSIEANLAALAEESVETPQFQIIYRLLVTLALTALVLLCAWNLVVVLFGQKGRWQ